MTPEQEGLVVICFMFVVCAWASYGHRDDFKNLSDASMWMKVWLITLAFYMFCSTLLLLLATFVVFFRG